MFGLFFLLLISVVVVLPIAIVFHVKAGIGYRKKLARRIHQLRLGKMLTALGIDTGDYIQTENLHDLKEQLEKCGTCENTAECDEKTAAGDISPENIEYCRNEKSWQKLVDEQKH